MNIVTAAGEVLTVNSSANSDLYWALRGAGSGNFGIVSSFVFRVHPVPPTIFVGRLEFPLDQFLEVFNAWQLYSINPPRSLTGEVDIADGMIEVLFVDATGSSAEFDRTTRKLFPLSRSRSTATYNYTDFIFYAGKTLSGENLKSGIVFESPSDFENIETGAGAKVNLESTSFYVQEILTASDIKLFFKLLKTMPETIQVRFEGGGGAINDLGETETAFVHRHGRLYNVAATFDPTTNSTSNRIGRAWLNNFFAIGKSQLFNHKETYQNYMEANLVNYLERYYGRNAARLIQIKGKYDPENYFNFPQSIPTKLVSAQDA
jgi:hypothetical protein